VKNARYSLPLTFRVAAGTPTDPTTPDTEFSIDGGATFSDCAEDITTGGTNGMGYLTLSGAETNNSLVRITAKSANCVTTLADVVPRVLPILLSGTAQAGAAGTITLASGTGVYSLAGCIVRTTGGTGGGGTGGANNQARVITAFNTSTKVATVSPDWETTPSSDTTYDILLTDMCPAAVEIALTNDTDTAAALAAQTTNIWQDTTAGNYTVANSIGLSVMNGVALGTGLTIASVSGNVGGIAGAITTLDALDTAQNEAISTRASQTSVDDLPTNAELATALDPLPTAAENAAALMDLSNGIETSITPRQALRLILAAAAGKLSGAATTTVTIRNVGDSVNRITATVNSDGDRTAITYDLT
jgi:hypothetical protein